MHFVNRTWKTLIASNLPRQKNSVDCGAFICQYANYATRFWATMIFEEEDIPHIRQIIMYEICTKKLLAYPIEKHVKPDESCMVCSTICIPCDGKKKPDRRKKSNGPAYQCKNCEKWLHVVCMPKEHAIMLSGISAVDATYLCTVCRSQ